MDCMAVCDCNSVIKVIGLGFPAFGALALTSGRIGKYSERFKEILTIVGLVAVYLGFVVQFLQACPEYSIAVITVTVIAAIIAVSANIINRSNGAGIIT